MIKRSTWVYLVILALVIGAYYLISNLPAGEAEPTPTAPGLSFLITEADGVLQSLQIRDRRGNQVQMQRNPGGTWVVDLPEPGEADQALAGAAETQVSALRIVATLDTPPSLSTVGLASPDYTIVLGFSDGLRHTLEVGSLTSIDSGYYVRFDGGVVHVVSRSGIDSLLNLLVAPPYVATETPTPASESTPEPELETSTPTPT